jgi:SAM-dependent methyltransferase
VGSPDVADQHGAPYGRCRFLVRERWPSPEEAAATHLFVRYADGTEEPMADAVMAALLRDRYGMPWARFLEHLRTNPPGRVLELGSRGEQGTLYRDALPPLWAYTGFDIEPGHNVDVVGDAHELSRHVEPESFDALLSVATFEHLAMPWKVAVEINKVLKPGGVAVLVSHQCWPVHEQPWDFWRFSTWAWRAMFNEASGFEVLEAVMGEPARVVPELLQPVTAGVADGVAYLGSAALVRKTGPTGLSWEVPTEAAAEGSYPVP